METLKGFKRPKKTATPALRKSIWELYIGFGVQEATCPLCGLYKINQSINSAFEAAHVVARKFMDDEDTLSVYYLFPSCAVCNNECRDQCIFDFLYNRQRHIPLKRMIMAIFNAYVAQHDHELAMESRMAWMILARLYGKQRYPAGGGIVNEKAIYEIARAAQYAQLVEKGAKLVRELENNALHMRQLLECDIKPLTLI